MGLELDIERIEGIGEVYAQALKENFIHTIRDLLFYQPAAIQRMVGNNATIDEASSWRAMAVLIQVNELTPQYAEALVRRNVSTIENVSNKKLGELETLFSEAESERLIPAVPTSAEITEMISDAVKLEHTGSYFGILSNSDLEPIENATLRLGNRSAMTDKYGRFMINKIPLGHNSSIYTFHDDYDNYVIQNPSLKLDQEVFAVHQVTVDDLEVARELDEYYGDVLPYQSRPAFTTKHHTQEQIRAYDIFFIQDFYDDGETVKLGSVNKAFIDGKIVVRTYRVALSEIPDGVERLDYLTRNSSTFAVAPKDYYGLLSAWRSLMKQEKDGLSPSSPEEAKAQFLKLIS
ncbi:DUF4332 domain-containing protein [Aquimarina intermedia]|uniref:Uncharacterized protein DUF4332 n=1 Tax=Aquimarina intermedia TaxID=350814 RepID=A0A5S5C9I8_9FLAO|nr:DUF4332 domain-containing protein [Aquimarina intermedia]TYP75000.1 uncharacterized protein DUF4332 [Aquimarina intermedia]